MRDRVVANYITLGTAILSFVAAAIAALVSMYNSKKIAEVHIVMNSRMTDALTRIEQLGNALQASGIVIPDDPNLKTGNANSEKNNGKQ